MTEGLASLEQEDGRCSWPTRRRWGEAGEALSFLVLYGLLIWGCADPRLLYHANWVALAPAPGRIVNFPLFYLGGDFFREFAAYPGGLTDYAGAFLSQLFYYPSVGASLLALVAAAYLLVTDRVVCSFGGNRSSRVIRYAPPLALLAAYMRSTYILADSLRWLIALIAAWAYVRLRPRRMVLRAATVVVLASCLFWVAGGAPLPGGAQILFAVLCGLFEVRMAGGGWLRWSVVAAAAGASGPAAVACAAGYVMEIPNMSICPPPDQASVGTWTDVAAYATLCLFVVLAASMPMVMPLLRRAGPENPLRWAQRKGGVAAAARRLAPLLFCAAVGLLAKNDRAQKLLQINYAARNGLWSDMLAAVRKFPTDVYPKQFLFDTNRALFETGRMGWEDFSYRQEPAGLLPQGLAAAAYLGALDTHLQLGLVNNVEQYAHEAIVLAGNRPQAMRLLAVVNIVKGEPETARVFLQVLSKDLIYGRWARQTARRLRADPTLAGDPEIDRVRSVMLKEDLCDPRKEITFGKLMETLWRSCPDNRMAAAYQMADYLLTREVGDVVRMVDAGRVKEMGHKSMPRHYAEAVLLHEQMTGQRPRLHGMSLDPYRDDLARFRMLRMRDNGRGELLAAELARELPNSYMRYYETGQSGGRHE